MDKPEFAIREIDLADRADDFLTTIVRSQLANLRKVLDSFHILVATIGRKDFGFKSAL
ncbi:hypothetical protein D3C87_2160800 [compost metagenome]